jgi:two-component system copper resistance phosphate regulon response regulator CusR
LYYNKYIMRILIVEDEKDLREILKKRLTREHYSVDACGDGSEAVEYMEMASYDGIILDIMLPGKDGFTILKEVRGKGDDTPILMLTARDGIEDRVKGLDLGADDYLVKPFAFDELLARIRVMMRRKPTYTSNRLTAADLILDRDTRKVWRAGCEITLSAKEFMVLECLMRNQGIVLSRNQIEQNAWDFDFEGGSNVIDVYIRYLRKKIDEGFDKKLIHTVRGAGYVLRDE